MNRSTTLAATLTATDAVANVERYLAQQYAKRKVVEAEKPVDVVVVILAWCVVVMIWFGK